MKKVKHILRPLGVDLGDCYSKNELLSICDRELFVGAKVMDIDLLGEALLALDDRPDDEVAPHRSRVWAKICERTHPRMQVSMRKPAFLFLLILLLLALVGAGLAWATHAGVLSFPSIALPWLPQVESDAAQSLVQTDLYTATYEHCELRVREAAFDGHQLRIVYSLQDTRENAALTDDDLTASAITAAQLDGIGCCDYLTLDGQDVYLNDIIQLPGEENAEMLYYLAANIDEDIQLKDIVTIHMPIGEFDLQAGRRMHNDVTFTLDISHADADSLSAQKVTVAWGNTQVEIVRAVFSSLHGLVEIRYSAVDSSLSYERKELRLFTTDGQSVGQVWYASYSDSNSPTDEIITQYIPIGSWLNQMVLAPVLADGSMDTACVIPLVWKT